MPAQHCWDISCRLNCPDTPIAGTCQSVLQHIPLTHVASLDMVVSKGHAPLHISKTVSMPLDHRVLHTHAPFSGVVCEVQVSHFAKLQSPLLISLPVCQDIFHSLAGWKDRRTMPQPLRNHLTHLFGQLEGSQDYAAAPSQLPFTSFFGGQWEGSQDYAAAPSPLPSILRITEHPKVLKQKCRNK